MCKKQIKIDSVSDYGLIVKGFFNNISLEKSIGNWNVIRIRKIGFNLF